LLKINLIFPVSGWATARCHPQLPSWRTIACAERASVYP